MPKVVSAARWAAYQVLRRVEQERGFAGDLLHSPLTSALDERDAALAEELALGVLRWQGELDRIISEAGGRPAQALDLEVRIALRLGAYQLLRLDRIPARAAVSESVEIVKRARKSSAAGLVNAVLRKAASHVRPGTLPEAARAVPAWLLERWRRRFGASLAEKLALQTLNPPPVFLRLNARFDTEETLRLLAAEGVATERAELPYCCKVLAGRPARTECFRQGRIRLQDLGSQRIVPLLALEPQHRFLDLCAAPGGKTFQALEQRMPYRASGVHAPDSTDTASSGAEPGGLAVACDRVPERLLTMRRLATLPVAMVALDAACELPFRTRFDRILVDAPCSGTGTLARNPEIKWKLRPEDIGELAARQKAMLSRALPLLAPAGRLVYSTCSLEPEENEEVVNAVLGSGIRIVETHVWLPGENQGDGFFACVIAQR